MDRASYPSLPESAPNVADLWGIARLNDEKYQTVNAKYVMLNATPLISGFHLPTLRRKSRSERQILAFKMAAKSTGLDQRVAITPPTNWPTLRYPC